MKIFKIKRMSHCIVCNTRLSTKSPSGEIYWQPCQINDKGIYCQTCYKPLNNDVKAREKTLGKNSCNFTI